MSDDVKQAGIMAAGEHDRLLQATCQEIVKVVGEVISWGPAGAVASMHAAGDFEVGRQTTIDATEKGGLMNICRFSILNPDVVPNEEVARLEYEHDKQGKLGLIRAYSIQSVRRKSGELVLMENFLADDPTRVREADFRPVQSEAYAQQTVLATAREWAQYRKWQLQQGLGR